MTRTDEISELASLIRKIDGNHDLGAGSLAEHLYEEGVRVLPVLHLEPLLSTADSSSADPSEDGGTVGSGEAVAS